MGKVCTISREKGGRCTSFDGLIDGYGNGWNALRKIIKKIPCDSCREDGLENLSALQDIVNLSIGEITEPYDRANLDKFMQKANRVYNFVKGGHDVKWFVDYARIKKLIVIVFAILQKDMILNTNQFQD